jgi:hypothetical protein
MTPELLLLKLLACCNGCRHTPSGDHLLLVSTGGTDGPLLLLLFLLL